MYKPALYRKKPVALKAWQVTSGNLEMVAAWCEGQVGRSSTGPFVIVHSLDGEGSRKAHPGDWVVQGTRGEFWRVREDIFAETYEAVSP